MIKFAHTNIITDNWQALADFYIKVFGCRPLYPERDLNGQWLEQITNIPNAHLRGIHLVLPGYENNLPTLEIFQYDENLDTLHPAANRKGFGHIAFKVDDVEAVLAAVIAHGGSQLGPVAETDIAQVGHLTIVYAQDIDGNIVELQNWR